MKITAFALAMASILPAAALAQATSESGSNSAANSHVTFEGTNYERPAPGLGGIGTNSTAPCVIGQGFGVVGPGAGIQWSGGKIDESCLTRTEAAMLRDMLNMPQSPGKQAAIAHACRYSDRLQTTLVATGHCIVRKR